MIENVGTNKLKRYHAGGCAPLQVILEQPHAWIADHKPGLPSQVVFQISFQTHFCICTAGTGSGSI